MTAADSDTQTLPMSQLSVGAVTASNSDPLDDSWNRRWAYTPEISDDSLIDNITGGCILPIRNSWLDRQMEERERVRFLEEEERYAAAVTNSSFAYQDQENLPRNSRHKEKPNK